MNFFRHWYLTKIATWALVLKKREIAYDYYAKIIAEDPSDALTLGRVAFLHAEDGRPAQAVREFQRVVAINPKDADSWFNMGYLQQNENNHADALKSFQQAIDVNERHDRAWYGKALSLIALKRDDDAIAPLRKNIELQPMSPHGHMELARCYFRLGDVDRCEKRMRKLKEFDPKNTALLEDETGIRVGVERWWKN
jgi:tetratricopeptide (TPR) repeat protein